MDKITELREKRAKIVADQRRMLDKAEAEKRGLTADENTNYANMEKDFDNLTNEIKSAEQEEQRKLKLAEREAEMKQIQSTPTKPAPEGRTNNAAPDFEKRIADLPEPYRNVLREYRKITGGQYSNPEYEESFRRYLMYGERGLSGAEARALQADKDTTGGFLVAPELFIVRLIQALDNQVFVRRYATVIPIPNAASLGAPALDHDPGDPTWTAEIKIGSEDSTMDFDKRQLQPHPLARYLKVSKKLLRVSLLDIEALIRNRLAYKFSVVEENAFLNGSGANQPLGIFVASANGINTGRDVSTGNAATGILADNLINCKYALKAQYRARARWLFHRDALKMIRKLKTGEGDYIWQQGVAADRPDTIIGLPYDESEYCPNTFTTGLYVGALCDWANYWIADALNMEIQVLTELYAATNQNGYIARKETDGAPVLEEGFVRVKLG